MAFVARAPLSDRNQVSAPLAPLSGGRSGNLAGPRVAVAGATEVKTYKLPELVVRPASPKARQLVTATVPGGALKPTSNKRKSPADNTPDAGETAVTLAPVPLPPAAAPTSAPAPAADEIFGPLESKQKATAQRPARVALPPAAVATELAVQRRQQAEAEAASRGPQDEQQVKGLIRPVPFAPALRCGDACCPQPFRLLAADNVARQVGCTAGCVVQYHSDGCSHGSGLKVAWQCPGAPCPIPDCGGVTLYAAEMDGAGVFKAFKYGEQAKAEWEEAARQRKKQQQQAAAKKAAKKAGMQERSSTAAKKAAKPTADVATEKPATAASVPAPALAAAAAQALREANEAVAKALVQRSDPVLVLPPRTPSPLAAPRQHHRNSPPPLPQAARGRSSLGNAEPINTENAWLRRRAASTGAVSAAEDDEQLIHLAGRYASSCASAEADSGDSSGGEEALAMPSLPAQVAGDSAVNLTSVAAFWAAVDAQASLQAFAVSFAPLSPAKDDVAKDEVAPVPPKSYKAAIELKAVAHPAAVATAAPAVVPAAPLVLRLGAAPHLQSLHKTELCRWWALGCCTRGEDCTFAHGAAEQRCKPVFRCHYFDGPQGCYYGEACKYSHEAQGC